MKGRHSGPNMQKQQQALLGSRGAVGCEAGRQGGGKSKDHGLQAASAEAVISRCACKHPANPV